MLDEYIRCDPVLLEQLLEQNAPPDPNAPQEDPNAETDPNMEAAPVIEFEELKRYILYGKIKEIKRQFEIADVDSTDSRVNSIREFLSLILIFYNTISYIDLIKLTNNLLISISEITNIKLPKEEQIAV